MGANEASRSEKVRCGGAVRALMPENPGPPSSNLDRDGFPHSENGRKKTKKEEEERRENHRR